MVHEPVAQPDRAPDFESGGRGFESLRARHLTRSKPIGGKSIEIKGFTDYRLCVALRDLPLAGEHP